jgi:hypothetical protein
MAELNDAMKKKLLKDLHEQTKTHLPDCKCGLEFVDILDPETVSFLVDDLGCPPEFVTNLDAYLRRTYVPDQTNTAGGRPPKATTPDERRAAQARRQREYRQRLKNRYASDTTDGG